MVLEFSRVRSLRLVSEEDCNDTVVLFTSCIKPQELDGVDIDCYKVSKADMALIRDAFKR
ncbi:hypothetical protein BI347_02590 [Chromobacterium sphagni]|uniref:Uncharacterized protein n=1 Tax=Chromobacterium sphagni TaxID=1903179 RepID=A0A1S1WYY7_9NEIS|nr:hypothetical protein BI347_02590 [Chromobacterium sphagni]